MVIAGGDGSLLNTIDEALTYKIDIDSMFFGILPFGSGNDLAGQLGWGLDPKKIWTDNYCLLAKLLINSVEERLNIWEIKAFPRQSGQILKWDTK